MELLNRNNELKKQLEQSEFELLAIKKNLLEQPKRFRYMKSIANTKQSSSYGNTDYEGKKIEIKNRLAVCQRYFGISVKEWSSSTRIIVFDISLNGKFINQYSINMTKTEDPEEWKLYKYHLPVGFPLDIITNRYLITTKEYFCAIHQALTCFYDRSWQINQLKENLPSHVQLNHINYSTLELIVPIEINQNDIIPFHFILQYDLFKTRPDGVNVTQFGVSYSEVITNLKAKSQLFLTYTLYRAFELIFIKSENEFYRLATSSPTKTFYDKKLLESPLYGNKYNVSNENGENLPYCSNTHRSSIEHVKDNIEKGFYLNAGPSTSSVGKFRFEDTKWKKTSKEDSKSSNKKGQNKKVTVLTKVVNRIS